MVRFALCVIKSELQRQTSSVVYVKRILELLAGDRTV